MKKRKSIILAMPSQNNAYKLATKELKRMGYDVTTIISYHCTYSLSEKIKFKLLQRVYKDEKALLNKLEKQFNEKQKKKLLNHGKFDFCLVISPGMFDMDILNLMKERSNKMIGFYWDGLGAYHAIDDRKITIFDDCYVFDKNDVAKYPEFNLKHATIFYYENQKSSGPFKQDFYFLGTSNKNRNEQLSILADYFTENSISYKFEIYLCSEDYRPADDNIFRINKPVPYKQYLKSLLESKYMLDLLNLDHAGLSTRIYESLAFEKKLITNNKTVKEYDFFLPENIFVFGERPLHELKDFLESDYKKIAPDILEQYRFGNWFNSKIDKYNL